MPQPRSLTGFARRAARDIVPPERIIADGSSHRYDAEGENGKGDAAYLLCLVRVAACPIGSEATEMSIFDIS